MTTGQSIASQLLGQTRRDHLKSPLSSPTTIQKHTHYTNQILPDYAVKTGSPQILVASSNKGLISHSCLTVLWKG